MSLDPGSGARPNEVAADSSLDPNDTQESLESDGRLNGYALVYRSEEGVVVATRVDLWRDSGKASRGMKKMVDDFERVQRQKIGGLTITDVSRFRGRVARR
jgi:hypothetical protein